MNIPTSRCRITLLFVMMVVIASMGQPSALAQAKLPIAWTVTSTNTSVAAGASVRVEITARIDDGWHLYSLTQQAPPDPTRITVPEGQPFKLGGKVDAPVPETGFDKAQDAETEYYTDSVAFKVPLAVVRTTAPGKYVAHIKATWQACNGSLCIRPQIAALDVPVVVTAAK
jgi:DsbC/DsbD-like thiol-disulfide interchange protein